MLHTQRLVNFILEREAIRKKKEAGAPFPWTTDSILSSYSFCNVRRADDRVSKHIAAFRDTRSEDTWFWMLAARFTNWPETIDMFPPHWDMDEFAGMLKWRWEHGEKVFNSAYIISTNGAKMVKTQYIAKLLDDAWRVRKSIEPVGGDTLQSFFERLLTLYGVASFMAGQVVADTKYVAPLTYASDWWTWACSGPGSKRGLNRVLGVDVDKGWGAKRDWFEEFTKLRNELTRLKLDDKLGFTLQAQDLQNCLCEFDKYERARLGEGRPKMNYNPNKGG